MNDNAQRIGGAGVGMPGAAVACMLAMVVLAVAGALPVDGDTQTAVFRTPIFLALAGLLCILIVAVTFHRGRPVSLPFLLAHWGAVMVIAGGYLGWRYGISGQVMLPVVPAHEATNVVLKDRRTMPLGFRLRVLSFQVEHYAPRSDQSSLQRGVQTPKSYEARLALTGPEGVTEERLLRVNHPVKFGGWRVYLASYEAHPMTIVSLSLRYDPARGLVHLGIWVTIIGVGWLCWSKALRREAAS